MFPPLPPPPPPPPDCTELSSSTTTTTTFIFLKIKPKLTEMKVNKSRAFETSMRYFNTILTQKVWRRVKFFFRHGTSPCGSSSKNAQDCNVLRLINAKRTFARTYDRAYKEIQDEIVLLLGQVKCFHLSETESMKEHFISFSDFPYFFKQKSTAMHYLTLFQAGGVSSYL